MANIIIDINDLKETFEKITITTSKIEVVPNEETNITILKSKSSTNLTPELFRELQERVKVLRTNFVS